MIVSLAGRAQRRAAGRHRQRRDGLSDQPDAEETSVVAKVDPKEVLSLLASKSGQIYMGMANDGQLSTLSAGHANKGTFTSPVLDAQQISRFGKIHLHGIVAERHEADGRHAQRQRREDDAIPAGRSGRMKRPRRNT